MKLDTPRTNDSPDHADVFLTPEKTETLINESQLDVQVDSTRSSTPGIGNTMVLQSISKLLIDIYTSIPRNFKFLRPE